MNSFHQQFTIHPVGQGLFYSGIIETEIHSQEEQFKFVFDCGSLTAKSGDEEAEVFRDKYLPDPSLDRLQLLVISHFDADHVNKIATLLKDKRKIDKLVMPFTLFEERLFLALRYKLSRGTSFGTEDDIYTIRLIIDPIGTLSANFDEDTTIYIITPDPDNPTFILGGAEEDNQGLSRAENITQLQFDFERTDDLSTTEKNNFKLKFETGFTFKKVVDSTKANLYFKNNLSSKLVEFLFYHVGIGKDEELFYKEVYKKFCGHFSIDVSKESDIVLDEIIEKVKLIKGSELIKRFFKEAREIITGIKVTKKELFDLNTTSLCLLHFNLPSVLSNFSNPVERWTFSSRSTTAIKKFDGTNLTRIEQRKAAHGIYHFPFLDDEYIPYSVKLGYPNTLLTSDTFLLQPNNVDVFYKKYQNYWTNIWLFQIPHHGSKKSSSKLLFSKLKAGANKFINYGTNNQYSHPNSEVIIDLIGTSQSENILAVNEFSGYQFEINFQ